MPPGPWGPLQVPLLRELLLSSHLAADPLTTGSICPAVRGTGLSSPVKDPLSFGAERETASIFVISGARGQATISQPGRFKGKATRSGGDHADPGTARSEAGGSEQLWSRRMWAHVAP